MNQQISDAEAELLLREEAIRERLEARASQSRLDYYFPATRKKYAVAAILLFIFILLFVFINGMLVVALSLFILSLFLEIARLDDRISAMDELRNKMKEPTSRKKSGSGSIHE